MSIPRRLRGNPAANERPNSDIQRFPAGWARPNGRLRENSGVTLYARTLYFVRHPESIPNRLGFASHLRPAKTASRVIAVSLRASPPTAACHSQMILDDHNTSGAAPARARASDSAETPADPEAILPGGLEPADSQPPGLPVPPVAPHRSAEVADDLRVPWGWHELLLFEIGRASCRERV